MKRVLLFLCIVFCLFLNAQENAPIVNYTPKEYNAQNQNWSIAQASNNYIYVANNAGLLEFDGAKWNLYEVPDQSIVRTVEVVNDKIYTGSFMDFGVWEKDVFGKLVYSSLVDKIGLEVLEDEQFWNIEELDGWLIFQSLSRIYLINSNNFEYKVINSDVTIPKIFKVNNAIYFQQLGLGVFKIENGNSILINNEFVLKDSIVVNIIDSDNGLLVFTEDNGIYKLSNNEINKWTLENTLEVDNLNIYTVLQLSDNTIVLGTISNGIIFLNPEGSLKQAINHNSGLSNNTVLSLFEDSFNNLWVGLDNGINCINLSSKYKIYTDNIGAIGTVYASLSHKNHLYLGTNQGLFFKERHKDGDFSLINGTKGQVWTLKNINGELFCGHNYGTFIIDNGKVISLIDNETGSWDFKLINDDPNLILQGSYKGLSLLEKVNNKWRFKNKLIGFDISSRFFEKIDNTIYVNHEFKGLYKLISDNTLTNITDVNLISIINKETGSSLFKFSNDIYYSNLKGVYKYSTSNSFTRDEEFSSLFKNYSSLSTLLDIKGEKNKLWRYADNNILIVSPSSVSSKPQVDSIPISNEIRNSVAGFENLSKISENEYLIGTSNGYIILNNSIDDFKNEYEIQINSIHVNKIDHPKESLKLNEAIRLKNKRNNLEFNYSIPNYNKLKNNHYQYQLIGLSDKWSKWEEKPSHLFENLPFGSYTFNVRGKIGDQLTTNIASYSFSIERPWFLSNLSIALYVIGLIVIFLIFHNAYKRYYKKQRIDILKKAQKELELKELESKQELTSLKNEKLKQDIENKSRELAISTMSLIKKNEFLNTIKKDLIKIDSNNHLKSVIRIIDNNINNTDDWKLFEEAFNNADKEFLNKIKDKHPNLTPNDLKLCAYLRLNLSSKEIAPLLNISHRSVEVKRYRLRKKMELAHESSLTKYILEL